MTTWLVGLGGIQWSIAGPHTGSTDITLTPEDRLRAARRVPPRAVLVADTASVLGRTTHWGAGSR